MPSAFAGEAMTRRKRKTCPDQQQLLPLSLPGAVARQSLDLGAQALARSASPRLPEPDLPANRERTQEQATGTLQAPLQPKLVPELVMERGGAQPTASGFDRRNLIGTSKRRRPPTGIQALLPFNEDPRRLDHDHLEPHSAKPAATRPQKRKGFPDQGDEPDLSPFSTEGRNLSPTDSTRSRDAVEPQKLTLRAWRELRLTLDELRTTIEAVSGIRDQQ